jgi:uncharacterized protein (DUF1684 family)
VTRIDRSLPEPEFIQHVPPVPADADPNHHLWRNGRLWWIAFTVHRGHLQERVRFSLQTADVAVARRRRDQFLALFAQAEDLKISIRFAPRRGRGRGKRAA